MPFTGPRPYWVSAEVKPLWAETSFGIPSGHAQQSVAVWGSMAAYFRRGWGWIMAGFLMLMIGLSRAYLGAHFFIDLIVGWLIGALLLWIFLRYWDPVVAWAGKQTLGMQILYAFLASLTMIFLGWIAAVLKQRLLAPRNLDFQRGSHRGRGNCSLCTERNHYLSRDTVWVAGRGGLDGNSRRLAGCGSGLEARGALCGRFAGCASHLVRTRPGFPARRVPRAICTPFYPLCFARPVGIGRRAVILYEIEIFLALAVGVEMI